MYHGCHLDSVMSVKRRVEGIFVMACHWSWVTMRMKIILIWILLMTCCIAKAQELKKHYGISIIPNLEAEINGIGLGIGIQSLKYESDTLTTVVNGLNVELLGVGLLLPMVGSDPLLPYNMRGEDLNEERLDSLINSLEDKRPYQINGVALSLGGLAGHEIDMNGLNLSGLNTFTSSLNGFSASLLMNFTGRMRGVSIGVINKTLETKGVQIGLVTHTERLDGVQIGLWNRNEKRALPFFNWNFKK